MGSQVIEVSASCYVGLYTPRQVFAIVIQIAWWLGKAYLDIDDVADGTFLDKRFYFLKVGQIAAVVRNKTWNTRFLGNAVDAAALFVSDGHRFFDIDRLACLHGHDGICGMRRRGSGDVDSIYVFIVYQLLGVVIPFGNVALLGVCLGFGTIATHDSHDFGAFYFLESGAALVFGHFSATDETPSDLFSFHCARRFFDLLQLQLFIHRRLRRRSQSRNRSRP